MLTANDRDANRLLSKQAVSLAPPEPELRVHLGNFKSPLSTFSPLFVLLSFFSSCVKSGITEARYSHKEIDNFIFRALVTLTAPVCQVADISGSCGEKLLCVLRVPFTGFRRNEQKIFHFLPFLWGRTDMGTKFLYSFWELYQQKRISMTYIWTKVFLSFKIY